MSGEYTLIVEECRELRSFYEKNFENCKAVSSEEKAHEFLNDSSMLILDEKSVRLAESARENGYDKGIVFFGIGSGLTKQEVYAMGIDEIWCKGDNFESLNFIEIFDGVLAKYTAEKPNLLIVDDEEKYRDLFSMYFVGIGYNVMTVENAEEAIKYVPSVHVIVSDVSQPGSEGGLWLLKKVRSQYGDKLPFILMSGRNINVEDAKKASAFFEKPFGFPELEDRISRLLPQYLKQRMTAQFS